MAWIIGTRNNDTLTGTNLRDLIYGRRGDDTIQGNGGNDLVIAGSGNDVVEGGTGNDLLLGGRGNDQLAGDEGNDVLLGGGGNDQLTGGDGNDLLLSGSGNDTLAGGGGSDYLKGGSGNDVALYVMSENVGASDRYAGGSGSDTLRLAFSGEEWLQADVQADIANYLTFLDDQKCGKAPWGKFQFSAFDLEAKQFEKLEVYVDGVQLNPEDEPVVAADDDVSTTESGSVSGDVLDNDDVPDLVKSVTLMAGPVAGVLTFNDDGSFIFDTDGQFEYLAEGETATQTFTYEVTDADGDTDTATATITVTGTNDDPVITAEDLDGAVTEGVPSAGDLTDSGSITFDDVDLNDVHLVSATGTPIGSVLGTLTAVKDSDTTGTGSGGELTWTYTVAAAEVEYLAKDETRVESFTITLDDQNGGLVTKQIDITITGDLNVIVTTEGDSECRLTTFEGGGHFEPINPDSGGLIPAMNAYFPDWYTLTSGNYYNNPSPPTITVWLSGDSAETTFQEPVSAVSLYYASRADVTLQAFNDLGELIADTSAPANNTTGAFDDWDPLSVSVEENAISWVVLTGGATQTAVDDFKACSIISPPPIITSDGGGDTANISIDENTAAVTTIMADDQDGLLPSMYVTETVDISGLDALTGGSGTETSLMPDEQLGLQDLIADADEINIEQLVSDPEAETANGDAPSIDPVDQTGNVDIANVSTGASYVSGADIMNVVDDGGTNGTDGAITV